MPTSDDKQQPTLSNLDQEDDLDDLDDVLDQFNPQSPGPSPPAPPPTASTTTSFGRPRTNTRVDVPPKSVPGGIGLDPTAETDEDAVSAEFERELAKGMESLMREIGLGAAAENEKKDGGEGEKFDDEQLQNMFKAAWEQMLVEGLDGKPGNDLAGLEEFLGNGTKESKGKETGKGIETAEAPKSDFQGRLQQALGKMRESESNLKDSTSSSGADLSDADMQALFASLGNGGNEEDYSGLLENLMSQVMSKEVLYEPMTEMRNKFPTFLANPPTPISDEDRKRFEQQQVHAEKMVALFEDPSYSDADPVMKEKVANLMAEMGKYGDPPAAILGTLVPEGLEGLPAGDCTIA